MGWQADRLAYRCESGTPAMLYERAWQATNAVCRVDRLAKTVTQMHSNLIVNGIPINRAWWGIHAGSFGEQPWLNPPWMKSINKLLKDKMLSLPSRVCKYSCLLLLLNIYIYNAFKSWWMSVTFCYCQLGIFPEQLTLIYVKVPPNNEERPMLKETICPLTC